MTKTESTGVIRREYQSGQLAEKDLKQNPFEQLKQWMHEAIAYPVQLPDAMTIATADAKGTPDARIVLLKELDETGLIFFTNYESPTGQQIKSNPQAACVIWWPEMERQIRAQGKIEPVSNAISDRYFASRPRDSQLAAHASPQSKVISERLWLEERLEATRQSFENKNVTRPPNWGGFRIVPQVFEFWQGRENRLHDRFRYQKQSNGTWKKDRLAP